MTEEYVAQHVAAWFAILRMFAVVPVPEGETERIAAPKEASVTRMSDDPGIFVTPKSTAVPAGDDCVPRMLTLPQGNWRKSQ